MATRTVFCPPCQNVGIMREGREQYGGSLDLLPASPPESAKLVLIILAASSASLLDGWLRNAHVSGMALRYA